MKHKVQYYVEVEARGLFGTTKTVLEERTKWVTGREYRRIKREHRNRPFTEEEVMGDEEIVFDEEEF